MEWIDIKERQPEFETPVIVTGEGRVSIARLVSKMVTKEAQSLEFHEGDSSSESLWITVKYWMPIPQIPTT